MGNEITLIVFTCQEREHLLQKTFISFTNACNFKFDKIILAIDGQIDHSVISTVNPDIIIQHPVRQGYVNSIAKTLKLINTHYFFWLEDDWTFNKKIDIPYYLDYLQKNNDWAEIVLSQFGPLKPEFKIHPLDGDLYQTTFGFSANPALCNTLHIQSAFSLLETSVKGDQLGIDGFENFLTKTFDKKNIKCVIIDPVNYLAISHEGYLESTPRNWHMTNSLETKTRAYLLTMPAPSIARKLYMPIKLFVAFCKLGIGQFNSDKIYEHCFRIIASAKTIKKDD